MKPIQRSARQPELPCVLYAALALAIASVQAAPEPVREPAAFGVGLTSVTGTSARLVFTTSVPVRPAVRVLLEGREVLSLGRESPEEIHAFDLAGLSPDKEYRVSISGLTGAGREILPAETAFTTRLRPPSKHQWPGLTIFGASADWNRDLDLDLLARSGVKMARIEVPWFNLMPKGREVDAPYLAKVLGLIAGLKTRGIEPLVVLDYCVPWAKRLTDTTMTWRHPSFGPPDNLEDWEYYLRTVVSALAGQAKYFEIWNEPDAGYLATGSYVERPNLPPPIGRPPFKDNWNYWLGDRYVPMISRVRSVLDELEPGAVVMNGGWNRDYNGRRGDLLFQRGAAPFLDAYAFHTYSGPPISFARWFDSIDGGFRQSIDRLFKNHGVQMPLAVTEWGWPAFAESQPAKGFTSFDDARKFFLKSAFYFLSLQRVEILILFSFGIGPDTRDADPLFYMLVNRAADARLVVQPHFQTFQWLATTFGSRPYRALPAQAKPADRVKAYAIELQESGEIYLAAWQDGTPDKDGRIAGLPLRSVEISVPGVKNGTCQVERLDGDGKILSASTVRIDDGCFRQTLDLPEATDHSESAPVLLKITASTPPG